MQTPESVHLLPFDVAVEAAASVARRRGEGVYVVGGVVRDLLMGRQAGDQDLDLVVEGDAAGFAAALSAQVGGSVLTHPAFLTAKVVAPFLSHGGAPPLLAELDVATARCERYSRPGALPSVSASTLAEDLWRRDFSINAMAVPLDVYALHRRLAERDPHAAHPRGGAVLTGALIDPCAGREALRERVVRTLHERSFIDDPTRLFRAVRYCTRLEFTCAQETQVQFDAAVAAGVVSAVSARRVWNEAVLAFDEPNVARLLEHFLQRGLFVQHGVVSLASRARLSEAVQRMEGVRTVVAPVDFKQAGRLVLLATLPEQERARIVAAVQERRALVKQVFLLQADPQAVLAAHDRDVALLLAGYALAGSAELREALEERCRQGRELNGCI